MNQLNRYTMEQESILKLGRGCIRHNSFPMFYTASGIEFTLKGAELWIELSSTYSCHEAWISVLINDVRVFRTMVLNGTHKFCVIRNMNPETEKVIRITKDTQAMKEDPEHFLCIDAIYTDGTIKKPEEKPYKIEFIGDSITSGEGLIGAKKEEDWISCFFDSVNHYATLTSKELGAEYRILSQSGWGVLSGYDNNVDHVIPSIYELTCGSNVSDAGRAFGSLEKHEFTSWQPDYIVINLGTNDNGAFHNPSWTDPKTGKQHKLRLLDSGEMHPDDLELFEQAVIHFLHQVRRCNPNSFLIWAYGILGSDLEANLLSAMERYRRETDDEKINYLHFPSMTEDQVGARWHPGVLGHKMMAEFLIKRIRDLMQQEK